jgi:hypothetical protein
MWKYNELAHHGIKGMRWGIRRTKKQLGNAGSSSQSKPRKEISEEQSDKAKKSVANEAASVARNAKEIQSAISNIRKASRKGEDLSKISDSELREKVNRMNLEQQYSRLSRDKTSKGETYVSNALSIAGNVLAAGASAVTIALAIKTLKGG